MDHFTLSKLSMPLIKLRRRSGLLDGCAASASMALRSKTHRAVQLTLAYYGELTKDAGDDEVLFEVTMAALIGDALIPGTLRQAVLHGTKASAAVASKSAARGRSNAQVRPEQEGARSMTMQLRRWRCGNALW
jgi:hypothetical protein